MVDQSLAINDEHSMDTFWLGWKIHGVTPGFIREVREMGYEDIAADELVA